MRMNTPVTNVEFPLADNQTIVSTTDLSGNIDYANPYFIEVSGFVEAELIGAPQNILRHPDMPAACYADLWAPSNPACRGKAWSRIAARTGTITG